MADEQSSQFDSQRPVVWLAVAAMACLLLLAFAALGMAFFLRGQPSINNSTTINTSSTEEKIEHGPATPLTRPVNPGPATASRMSESQPRVPDKLPGTYDH